MQFEVNDIVRIIDKETFYYNGIGVIRRIESGEYPYYVEFEADDEETGGVFTYESCHYREDQIELI